MVECAFFPSSASQRSVKHPETFVLRTVTLNVFPENQITGHKVKSQLNGAEAHANTSQLCGTVVWCHWQVPYDYVTCLWDVGAFCIVLPHFMLWRVRILVNRCTEVAQAARDLLFSWNRLSIQKAGRSGVCSVCSPIYVTQKGCQRLWFILVYFLIFCIQICVFCPVRPPRLEMWFRVARSFMIFTFHREEKYIEILYPWKEHSFLCESDLFQLSLYWKNCAIHFTPTPPASHQFFPIC